MHKYLLLACLFILGGLPSGAQVILPAMFCDSMILQRDKPVHIWGSATPNEKITIQFLNRKYIVRADTQGKWRTFLPAQKAGGPHSMTITASNKITLKEILFGDVWFCAGQSNMVHQMNIHDVTYAQEIATANNPNIRQFWIPTLTSLSGPNESLPQGAWIPAVGEKLRPFSAVAYFFAKKIYEKYGIPIGIINASVGGTPIEAWTSSEGLKDFDALIKTIEKNRDTAYINELIREINARQKAIIPPADKGLNGEMPWYHSDYSPKDWRPINIPGYWEDQGIRNLDGIVWYRKEIDLPAGMSGKPATVWLGRIVDADELYINGKRIANTTYQYPQRRYKVAAGILKAGKNIFTIRVTNNAGKGGFVPDKPYCIFSGKDTIDLKGTWHYKVGSVFEPGTGQGGPAFSAQNQPAALFNAMVAPVVGYGIKGFLWYQGESNAGRPAAYASLQQAQIKDWRTKWKDDSLPFLFVQLPGFMETNYLPEESNWAMLRNGQLKSLATHNTAMAVAIDLGEWNDIHPDNKKDVGERLALAAFGKAYHENIVFSGPIFKSAKIEGDKIIIQFSHTGSGLVTKDGEQPDNFAIAGADRKFVWAQAKIEGDKIIVWSPKIKMPVYVRYAWADNPSNPNLYNKEGLPTSPFSTAD